MKRILLSSAAIVALTSASLAADLPSRKGPPIAPVAFVPVFTWTGFYVGLQGGYQWGRSSGTITDAAGAFPETYSYSPKGGVFGAHVGYNYQINAFVFGLEGDVEWSGMRGAGLSNVTPFFHRAEIDWQGSIRARAGVAFDRALLYATGGVALASIDNRISTAAGVPLLNYSETRAGWTLGGGLEYAVTDNVTIRGEYRYADYGRKGAVSLANNIGDRNKITTHTVRAGLSYKF